MLVKVRNIALGLLYIAIQYLAASCSLAESPRPLHIILHEHQAPFTYSENGKPAGISVDLYHELAKRLGIELKFSFANYPRALRLVYTGKADMAPAFDMPEMANMGLPDSHLPLSSPHWVFPVELYALAGRQQKINDPAELAKMKIGFLRLVTGDMEPASNANPNYQFFSNFDAMLNALKNGRIDMAGMGAATALHWSKKISCH